MAIKSLMLAIMALSSLGACAKAKSSKIDLSEIYITFTIDAKSGAITCNATFNVGNSLGTYLELYGSDSATCSKGSTVKTLEKKSGLIGNVNYQVTGLDYEAGGTYLMTFKRGDQSFEASTSLPAAVEVTSPTSGASVTKGAGLTATWTAATGASMKLFLLWTATVGTNDYSGSHIVTSTDDGSEAFSADQTQTLDSTGANVAATASAALTVTRTGPDGTFPSGLKGGSIYATEAATVSFNLID
jgi:hypothetical protein